MAQQTTMKFGNNNGESEHMLWYEDTDAGPEQAIRNAEKHYLQKYGLEPTQVVLPLKWHHDDKTIIKSKPLEETLGLDVNTDSLLQTRHVAVYAKQKEQV